MKTLFKDLPWYDTTLFCSMMLMAAATPIRWQLGVIALFILIVASLIKVVVTRHLGNPMLDKWSIVGLGCMVLLWIVFCISAIGSSNTSWGWHLASKMAPLMAFPLIFLLCDLRFLNDKRIRFLFFVLTLTVVVRFFIQFAQLLFLLFDNTSFEAAVQKRFDYIHHNYLSFYLLTAIAFLYSEAVRPQEQRLFLLPRWIHISTIFLISFYILLSGSRSGLVVWILLSAACFCHMFFVKRNWKGLLALVLILFSFVLGSYLLEPKLYAHFLNTMTEVSEGSQTADPRQSIFQCSIDVVKQKPILGHGLGDYLDVLYAEYAKQGNNYSLNNHHDSHNQYLETLMATGMVGLIVQLCMMLSPVVLAFLRCKGRLISVLFFSITAGCFCFEASLGRQMGLLFFCLWNCILILYSHTERLDA